DVAAQAHDAYAQRTHESVLTARNALGQVDEARSPLWLALRHVKLPATPHRPCHSRSANSRSNAFTCVPLVQLSVPEAITRRTSTSARSRRTRPVWSASEGSPILSAIAILAAFTDRTSSVEQPVQPAAAPDRAWSLRRVVTVSAATATLVFQAV